MLQASKSKKVMKRQEAQTAPHPLSPLSSFLACLTHKYKYICVCTYMFEKIYIFFQGELGLKPQI